MPVSARSEQRPPLLLIAYSARALAAAAAPAWQPWVIDAFADSDTRALATRCVPIETPGDLSITGAALAAALDICLRDAREPIPAVIGSGFEQDPTLLERVTARATLLGCDRKVFARLLDMPAVLAALRATGDVTVPETSRSFPAAATAGAWLQKTSGRCGGFHVRPATRAIDEENIYYQAFVAGPSCSALFLTSSTATRVCGMARHLAQRPGMMPGLHYQGAVLLPTIPAPLSATLERVGRAVARELDLHGGFGLDFILRDEREVVVVDINPRLTATIDLYDDRSDIFSAHVAACRDDRLLYSRPASRPIRGHVIVYAPLDWEVPDGVVWPPGAADLPSPGVHVAAGTPVVSLVAEADNPAAVYERLARSARQLLQLMGAPSTAFEVITLGGNTDVSARARHCL